MDALDGNRCAQALADALGHFDRVELVIDFGKEDELVSSEAGHHVDPAGHGGEPAGHLLEHHVTGGVVGPVVHQLEAVEIDEHHRQRRSPPADVAQGLVESLHEHGAVGQPGQAVV